jgi:hypothetical protein
MKYLIYIFLRDDYGFPKLLTLMTIGLHSRISIFCEYFPFCPFYKHDSFSHNHFQVLKYAFYYSPAPGSLYIIGKPVAKKQYFTRSKGKVMGTYEDIQNQTTEQTLREELQQVRKENEELASQVRALLTQLQSNQQYHNLPPGFSPHGPGHEPGYTLNEPAPIPPPPPPRTSQESHQYVPQPPTVQAPPINAPVNLTIPVTPTTATAQPTAIDKHSAE